MMPDPWPPTCSLKGERVALIPLEMSHCSALQDASLDGDLHSLWYTTVPSPENMETEINRRLALREIGSMFPFTILDVKTNKPVGMTTYMNIDATHKRVEIGSTWMAKSTQRTGMNTECKLLALTHAFEGLDCIAVEFRTHFMNRQSRTAIERLGAKLDGILRSHMVMANGTLRDTAVYSIIAPEWPAVKVNLQHMLQPKI